MPDFYHPEDQDPHGEDFGWSAARSPMAVVRARPGPSVLAGLQRAACRQARRTPTRSRGRAPRPRRAPEPRRARRAPGPQGYGQGYAQQGGYTPPAYTVQDQAYGAQDRPYADQAYGDQAYQGQQQGQPAPHWQAVSGLKPAGAKRSSDAKGFLGSLFDFSFTSFVTPKIVKVLYVLVHHLDGDLGADLPPLRLQVRRRGGRPVHADHRRPDLRAADARRVPHGARVVHGRAPDA